MWASLSLVGLPTRSDGTLRKNGCHNVHVSPTKVFFHTERVSVEAISFDKFIGSGFHGADGINWVFERSFERFWDFARNLSCGDREMVPW